MKRVPEQAAKLQSVSPNALKHKSVTLKIKTIGIFVIEACICQFLPQSISPAELLLWCKIQNATTARAREHVYLTWLKNTDWG